MSAEKAVALVVRGSDWSETSRITTLFTREFGKVRGLAKGGRRLKSSFEIAFDLLTVCRVVFLRSRSGGLDLLTEAQLVERFPAVRADLHALYAGYYVAELLADGTQDYDPHPVLYDAALDTLRGLADALTSTSAADSPKASATPPGVLDLVTRFELVWLRELGYSPRLETCAGCGVDVAPQPGAARVPYSPAAGGATCPACRPAARDLRWLSVPAWSALRDLAADEGGSPPPGWGDGVRRELRPLFGQTVSYVLGRRPRLLAYLDGTT